jgi:hypothetical protein
VFLREAFCGKPSHLTLLTNALFAPASDQNLIIRLLVAVFRATKGASLLDLQKGETFLNFVLERVDDSYFFEFFEEVLTLGSPQAGRYFDDIEFDRIMNPFLDSRSRIAVERILVIHRQLLVILPGSTKMVIRLQSAPFVTKVLEIGVGAEVESVAAAAFRLLWALCNVANNPRFEEMLQTLAENCAKLCLYVQRDHTFAPSKRFATELVTTVVSGLNTAQPYIFTFASFLFALLFEHQTNHFLHLAFFGLFQALSILKSGFTDWLTNIQITNEILRYESEREILGPGMRGVIHEITGIVDKIAINEKMAVSDGWEAYIGEVWRPTAAVMMADYGGHHPQPRPSIGPEAFCLSRLVDGCFLAALVDKGSSSSSSSGSDSGEDDEFVLGYEFNGSEEESEMEND